MRDWTLWISMLMVGVSGFAVQGGELDWPSWRGPFGSGHAGEGEPALEGLPDERVVVWEREAGPGLASPVVWGNVLAFFDAEEGWEVLSVNDAETGKLRWQKKIDRVFSDSQGPSGPRNTPVLDEDRVYAVSCRGELQCRAVSDGALLWRRNYVDDFGARFVGETGNVPGAPRHGNNGSPLIVGDRLYACAGGPGAGVVCLDKKTGGVIWKSQDDEAAYAPPRLATLAGVEHLLSFTVEGLIGLKSEDGQLLWRVPIQTAYGRHVTAPIAFEDLAIVSSHQAGLIATRVKAGEEGQTLFAEQAWLNQEAAMNFSTPVLVDGHLYGLGPEKDLICVDAASGERRWSKPGYIFSSASKAYASFLVVHDRLLILTDMGLLVLMDPDPDPEQVREVDRLQVCGMNWCNPALVDGRLYLRDGLRSSGKLLCIDLAP